jgi:polysaccharide pyruvyl transferase WcaK-like protein
MAQSGDVVVQNVGNDALAHSIAGLIEKTIDTEITPRSLFSVIIKTMEFVETLQGKSGGEKKELVLLVVKELVRRKVDGDIERSFLLSLCDTVIPSAIDSFVGITKGEVKINRRSFLCCF